MTTILSPQPIFTTKGNGSYVMEIDNRYFNIDDEVKLVMNILSQSKNYLDATKQYCNATKEEHTEEEFTVYASELLAKFNLQEKQPSFLLVEKILLPAKPTAKIASLFEWAFTPIYFWTTFIALVMFSIYSLFIIKDPNHEHGNFDIPVLLFFIGYFVTIIFHEFGHIAACRKFTKKNGGIGVGIYLIYPIFYSDISSIWHANKHQKVITNLAGIYMQLWCAATIYLIGNLTDMHSLVDFSKSLMIICFIQIIPFIRSDGYWLLSDLFNLPNLLSQSNKKFNELFTKPKIFFQTLNKKNFFILLYGLANITFVVLFAYNQIFINYQYLLEFPQYLWTTLMQIGKGNWTDLSFNSNYIPVLLFYYLVVTYGQKLIKLLFKNR